MSITCQLSRRILVNGQQPHGARGMPPEVFERIIGFKSEQNSSQGRLQNENIPILLSYGEPTSECNPATIAAVW
jgi:hypothetical protein